MCWAVCCWILWHECKQWKWTLSMASLSTLMPTSSKVRKGERVQVHLKTHLQSIVEEGEDPKDDDTGNGDADCEHDPAAVWQLQELENFCWMQSQQIVRSVSQKAKNDIANLLNSWESQDQLAQRAPFQSVFLSSCNGWQGGKHIWWTHRVPFHMETLRMEKQFTCRDHDAMFHHNWNKVSPVDQEHSVGPCSWPIEAFNIQRCRQHASAIQIDLLQPVVSAFTCLDTWCGSSSQQVDLILLHMQCHCTCMAHHHTLTPAATLAWMIACKEGREPHASGVNSANGYHLLLQVESWQLFSRKQVS